MSKLTLTDLASLTNETSAITTINNNNDAIEIALENTLSRDGTSPNSMSAQLDMNTHKIINLGQATTAGEALEYSQLQDRVDDLQQLHDEAQTYMNTAILAATNASNSAEDAGDSADDAAASALAAAASATSAASSASSASTSATNASNSASAAHTSETNAASSASSASSSASSASTSATNASNSASAASTSASNASSSASSASASAISAADSATAAAASADTFDDVYLGSKTSDPSTDNDGDPLQTGALYWNTSSDKLMVYDGASWLEVVTGLGGLYNVVEDTTPQLGGDLDINNHNLVFDTNDSLNYNRASNYYAFAINSSNELIISSSGATPGSNDGGALGSTSASWSDLFLATGAVINFNNGDVTLAHSSSSLTLTNYADTASVTPFYISGSRATPTNNDIVRLDFQLKNSSGTQSGIATIQARNTNVTSGSENGRLIFGVANTGTINSYLQLSPTYLAPWANDGISLGISTVSYSDLFLASGAVINFNNGDVTVTHGTDSLSFAGGSAGYSFDSALKILGGYGVVNGSGNLAIGSTSSTANNISIAWGDGAGRALHFGTNVSSTFTPVLSVLDNGNLRPATDDGVTLGDTSHKFSDLFLASGSVVDFNSGDVKIIHASNVLSFESASSGYYFDFTVAPKTNDAGALGFPTLSWSDLFLASGAVINFANSNYTLTHSTGVLTASADLRVTTPGSNSASVTTLAGGQTLTGGFSGTSYSAGTFSSGTYTPNPSNSNFQHATNNGAHTLAPPSSVCTMIIEYTNGASAGTITTSGFTKVNGDTLNTTNANKFLMFITKTNSYSMLTVQALQ